MSEPPNDILVTATRRPEAIQNTSIAITAITDDMLENQRTFNLREVSRFVPGAYVVDQGARNGTPIVFRGLNADPLGAFDNDNSGGGLVTTYVGDIPLYVDLRLIDIDRVEFVLGPQGTLYGAGTMAGAIRYLPKRPQLDQVSGEVRADLYTIRHGQGISSDTGATINLPAGRTIAFRGSIDYLHDRGFIDYPFLVTLPGAVNPNSATTTFKRGTDLNSDKTLTAHASLRFKPSNSLDVDLSYFYQDQRTGGRQFSSFRGNVLPLSVTKWENTLRLPEPNRRNNQLLALEATLDLGFAALTSATGFTWFEAEGSRDQTDLLLTLDPAFVAFPNLTARAEEQGEQKTFTEDLRLASASTSALEWLVGASFRRQTASSSSREYTPQLDQFFVQYLRGRQLDPSNLEYIAVGKATIREVAAYGEVGLELLPGWQVTAGGRYFNYQRATSTAVDQPMIFSVFAGRTPGLVNLVYRDFKQRDDGLTFKIGSSFQINDDAMIYGSVSTGYRMGNSNPVPSCSVPAPAITPACALPDEVSYKPDKTTNYELGFKSEWFDRRITLNGAIYYIEWDDPQIASVTANGALPITVNGGGAKSTGLELLANWRVSSALTIRGTYAFTNPKLTAISPRLIRTVSAPGFKPVYVDGQVGDRLPGSPRNTFSLVIDYERQLLPDASLGLSYQLSAQSNVLTTTGERGSSHTLPGFAIHGASITLTYKEISAELYIDNIFDTFAETGVRDIPASNQILRNIFNGPVYVRRFGTFVLPPRVIGLRTRLRF